MVLTFRFVPGQVLVQLAEQLVVSETQVGPELCELEQDVLLITSPELQPDVPKVPQPQ